MVIGISVTKPSGKVEIVFKSRAPKVSLQSTVFYQSYSRKKRGCCPSHPGTLPKRVQGLMKTSHLCGIRHWKFRVDVCRRFWAAKKIQKRRNLPKSEARVKKSATSTYHTSAANLRFRADCGDIYFHCAPARVPPIAVVLLVWVCLFSWNC